MQGQHQHTGGPAADTEANRGGVWEEPCQPLEMYQDHYESTKRWEFKTEESTVQQI